MRYYIEAYSHEGRPLLGNLDGQAALGEVQRPAQCTAWKALFSPTRAKHPRVKLWKLVNENGAVQQIYMNTRVD